MTPSITDWTALIADSLPSISDSPLFDAMDVKISRQFVWLVGIQISVLLAVVAVLVGG